MKRLALALAAGALLWAGPVPVQANEGCPMCMAKLDPGKKADKLALTLDLSDKQKEQVKALAEQHQAKMKPMMEQHMEQMKKAKDEFNAGLDKILTAAQKKKHDALMKMKEDEMGGCPMKH